MSEEVTTDEVVDTSTATPETEEKAFMDTFLESMTDEDLRGQKMWKELEGKSADDVGKYIRELKAFSGKKGDIPKPDAPQEEWDAFKMKLGRPESIDGYDFSLGEEFKQLVGEGQSEFYDQALEMFKGWMFDAGVPADKAESNMNDYLNAIAEQIEAVSKVSSERSEENNKVLTNEWGQGRESIELGIKAMLKDKGGMSDEDISEFENLGILKEPKLAIALAKINKRFEDDPELGEFMAETKSGIHEQIEELTAQLQVEYQTHGRYMPETKKKLMRLQAKL